MIDFAIGRDKVEVPLEQRHIVCSRHAEPFRAEWPRGWPAFASEVSERALDSPALQAGLRDPRFTRLNLYWEELPRRRTPAEVRTLLEARPACEWLDRQTLLRAYEASGVGTVAICDRCRLMAKGTRYGFADGTAIRHACFRCIVAGL